MLASFGVAGRLRLFSVVAVVGLVSLSIAVPTALSSIESPDVYPNPGSDYPWTPQSFTGVSDIQTAFNNGRINEGGGLPSMTLPSQAAWDAMSDNEKALWLVNSERQARGLMPLHGFDSNVTSVAQNYADYLLTNDKWGHNENGTTEERLEANAQINACHDDYVLWMENLAAFGRSSGSIPLPIERAIYGWMYFDSGSSWLHRQMILYDGYNDNSPPTGKEGLMGFGRANGKPYTINGTKYDVAEVIVMNAFDPCANWQYNEPPPPTKRYVFLPILLGKSSSSDKLLTGRVTYKGSPVQTTVELRYYDGSSWYIATADTNANGKYEFKDLPKLSGNKKYYVRYMNTERNESWLASWYCDEITASTTDTSLYRCDFDIENISLVSPNSGATVSLPQILSWMKRTTTSDSYELHIADVSDYDPHAWSDPPLGYVGSANMSSLPPGFTTGQQYGWWVRVLGSNGHGSSYYYYYVTFQ